jgi:peptide/nickel transport system substrate-binding protein
MLAGIGEDSGLAEAPVLKRLLLLLALLALAMPVRAQDRVVIASGVDVVGLDALGVIVLNPDRSLMDHISDTLLRWVAPGKLAPFLATSWSNIDPLTWELHLREGVTFQDGEPFDAESVKFSYETVLDPANKAPARADHTFVDHVQVIDPHTVRIITKTPYPTAPNQFTMLHMMPPAYVRKVGIDAYRQHPVGTGPYKFVEHVRDDHVTLQAWDGYWGGPQPIKTIIYRPIKEDAARVAALLAGEVDMVMDVPPEMVPLIQRTKGMAVKMVPSARVYVMTLSTLFPDYPTTKQPVREAINYGIDRASLNKNILGGTGAPSSWINPNTFGFNPDLKPLPYDPARAKKLLAEAGYPGGVDLVLDAPAGKYVKDKEIAEAMAGQLSQAGIRTTVKTYEWGVLTKRIWSHQASPLALFAWGDTRGDPGSVNKLVLQTGATWSQGKDAKLDALIDRIEGEMNPETRKALIYEEQAYLRETFPIASVVQLGAIFGTSAKLDWWQPRPDEKVWLYKTPKLP